MQSAATYYHEQGYNCSRCILKAAEKVYNLPVTEECMSMCGGVSSGFGIGGMCSLLIAGVMVFGLLFDEETVKRLRIRLLNEFNKQNGSLNCCALIKEHSGGSYCDTLVGETAALIEKIINEERAERDGTHSFIPRAAKALGAKPPAEKADNGA